jgi:hypothetical protein
VSAEKHTCEVCVIRRTGVKMLETHADLRETFPEPEDFMALGAMLVLIRFKDGAPIYTCTEHHDVIAQVSRVLEEWRETRKTPS